VKRDNLIVDVGMHVGQDTRFYLDKGFDVVAVEANPDLVAAGEEAFASEIREGRLRIEPVAIARERGTQRLAVSDVKDEWTTLSPELIERNAAAGANYRYVEVPAVPFEEILAEVGIPYFLKIDIEGLDMLCVEALHRFAERPDYLSVESRLNVGHAPFEPVLEELAQLWSLGYRRFAYVNMAANATRRLPQPPLEGRYVDARFAPDASGPFGRETPGRWEPIQRAFVRSQLLRAHQNLVGFGGRWTETAVGRAYAQTVPRLLRSTVGWYDLHAARTA
jgi:FkbM family methyltransferase